MSRAHGAKQIKRFIKEIEKIGFTVIVLKNKYKMYPPKHLGTRVYITHGTPKSIKPMCSEFRKIYGVELDPKIFL